MKVWTAGIVGLLLIGGTKLAPFPFDVIEMASFVDPLSFCPPGRSLE